MILGEIYAEAQEWERSAVHCLHAAAILPDSGDVRRHLTLCLRSARFHHPPDGLEQELLRCLHDPALDSEDIAGPAISILLCDSKPLENPLFAEVLQRTVVADLDFEVLLTRLRREMLLQGEYAFAWLPMAMQCLNNEHIWAVTPEEEAAVKPDALRFLMYAPLRELPAHLRVDLPAPLQDRLLQDMEEFGLREEFDRGIAMDGTTAKVKELYEENPFPRWFSTTILPPMTLAQMLRLQLPAFSPPKFYEGAPKFLLAGCGTGREMVAIAMSLPRVRITAIDISSASLSYAARMARTYGVSNVEFVQMDLQNVAQLGCTFDYVQCSGVLGHLADPLSGWKALTDVLRPGGLMRIGLYSELARRHIVAAQVRAASSGLSMRSFRQEILRERNSPQTQELILWPEFYSASGCRDLLFHVNERRSTIPQIRCFLEEQNLRFLGFLFRRARTEEVSIDVSR